MEAKAKAKELVSKFKFYSLPSMSEKQIPDNSKQCALITGDEIMAASNIKQSEVDKCKFVYTDEYWQEVKSEIEKL